MRLNLFVLVSVSVLDFVDASPKQCRVVNRRAAQLALTLPHDLPPRSTSPASTRSASTHPASSTGILVTTTLDGATSTSAVSSTTTATPSSTSTGTSSSTSTSTSSSATAVPTGFDYSKDKIRGVNLGGWLVLEPWITPSLFENTGNPNIVDEYTFNTLQDADKVQSVLTQHWDTWITEDDLQQISEAGLNHVRQVHYPIHLLNASAYPYRARLPIGYWSVPNPTNNPTPYNPNAWPYVLKAISWARKYNLFVIIDLHGALGSQNGYDNSGQRMGYPGWANDAGNVNHTLDAIGYFAHEFGGEDYVNVVTMIQLMNEPSGFYPSLLSVLQDYYERAYTVIRSISPYLIVALHDGFQPLSSWSTNTNVPSASNTMMDTHIYQIFNPSQVTMSWDDKLNATCSYGTELADYTSQSDGFRTYVGEWTTSFTDCAKWLNGRGVGARLDGTRSGSQFVMSCDGMTGSMSNFSDSYKIWMRRFFDAQTIAFERGNGWVYWTWKAEMADEWDYSKGLEGGWIPKDPTEHLYNAC